MALPIHQIKQHLGAGVAITQDGEIITVNTHTKEVFVETGPGQGVASPAPSAWHASEQPRSRPLPSLHNIQWSLDITLKVQADDEVYVYLNLYNGPLIFLEKNLANAFPLTLPTTLRTLGGHQDIIYFFARSVSPDWQMLSVKVYDTGTSALLLDTTAADIAAYDPFAVYDTNITDTYTPVPDNVMYLFALNQLPIATWGPPTVLAQTRTFSGTLYSYIWGPDGQFISSPYGQWNIFRLMASTLHNIV